MLLSLAAIIMQPSREIRTALHISYWLMILSLPLKMCGGIENILSFMYLSGCGKPQGDVYMLNVQTNTSSNLYL